MQITINPKRVLFDRDPMIYGHFLEHFHRQIYGGVYDPESCFADEDGFRSDVLDALRRIRVPIIRWPGGCFVSSYHWTKGVGPRVPTFDKAWRVEESNRFGTDEFLKLCEKLGCEPYICTNAGTGTAEEMSGWLEYCNLESEGEIARMRAKNGHPKPYRVKYWSIGNENYGGWEIGAKDAKEWGRLVLEASKMMKRVDPTISLTAAALDDLNWNTELLGYASDRLDWISIHAYWDGIHQTNALAPYEKCMGYTATLDSAILRVRGLLTAMGLEKRIRIAFDEWNLRGWYHPNVHTVRQGLSKTEYLTPRDDNDRNDSYTMADAVFSACFLNTLLRNADIVGMANFAPVVNTRGAIYTHPDGIVLRTTYHVFDLYVNKMGDRVVDLWTQEPERYAPDFPGAPEVDCVDVVAALRSSDGAVTVALVNKHAREKKEVILCVPGADSIHVTTLSGESPDDYNDVGRDSVMPYENDGSAVRLPDGTISVRLAPHSVNILEITLQ
jgi:alpha-N-arabinofuranosidase